MKRLSILAVALLAGCVAVTPRVVPPGPVAVHWTLPTENTDGTAIVASGNAALTDTRVEYGTCNGDQFGMQQGERLVPVPQTSTEIDFAAGEWCVRAFARNNVGGESDASAVAKKIVSEITPCPPPAIARRY